MTEEKMNQIAFAVAKRKILDTKFPPLNEFGKWITEGAKETGVSPEEFAKFAEMAFESLLEDIKKELRKIHSKKKKPFGFRPE